MARRRGIGALVLLGVFGLDICLWWNKDYFTHFFGRQSLTILLVTAVGYVTLYWRNRAPKLAFGAACLVSLIVHFLPASAFAPTLGVWLGMYAVVSRQRGPAAWLAPLAATPSLSATVETTAESSRDLGVGQARPLYVLIIGAVTAVVWLSARRRQEREAAQRLIDRARRALPGESYVFVAAKVSSMMVQAAGARAILRSDPERAATAMDDITHGGTQAIEALRRIAPRANPPGTATTVTLDPEPNPGGPWRRAIALPPRPAPS